MIDIPDGKIETIDYRLAEYYLKCPVRYNFNSISNNDFAYDMYTSLDQTISHSSLRLVVSDIPSITSLENQFLKRFKVKISKRDSQYSTVQDILDKYVERGSKLLRNYHTAISNIFNKYTVTMPSFDVDYTSNGLSLNIIVPFVMKRKGIKSGKPKYVLIDYYNTTKSWNTYGKLWATAIKLYLMDTGITTIEVGMLNLHHMKMVDIRPDGSSLARIFLDNMCKLINGHIVYPVYGKHCFGCVYQEMCSSAANY